MNLFPVVDEASARASEIAAAEKAVHDANTARHDSMKEKTGALVAILATLKEVRAQIYNAEQEIGVTESSDASLSVLKAVEKSLLKDLSNVSGGTRASACKRLFKSDSAAAAGIRASRARLSVSLSVLASLDERGARRPTHSAGCPGSAPPPRQLRGCPRRRESSKTRCL
jgi:hypothetical protein